MPTAKKIEEKTEKVVEAAVKKVEGVNGSNPVLKAVRSVLLVVIGTFAVGKEEIEAVVNRLVEKGEIAEKDGRELLSDLFERRQKDMTKAESKVEGLLDTRVEGILARMNIPSRGDVEELGKKIAELAKKVDDLTKKVVA